MAREAYKLTDLVARRSKPKTSIYKLADGNGLYLQIYPNGNKGWRFRYRFGGKEKMISFGSFPVVSLSDARNKCEEAKELLENSIDPSAARKDGAQQDADAYTLESLAREWFLLKYKKEVSEGQGFRVISRLEADVFPWLGARRVKDITAQMLLTCLRRIESRGALDTAHRVRSTCNWIFRYGVAIGVVDRNPALDLQGVLPAAKGGHMAAITDPKEFAKLLRAIEGYEGHLPTRCALRLAPILFVRPGELRKAEWDEIDLDAAEWSIPAEKMKMKVPHMVPLPFQAIDILEELKPKTGGGRYVFPSPRGADRPMSDNAILSALRRMGYEKDQVSGHGFRATARTMLDEILKYPPHIIEHQLAHAVRDPLGRAYNRTQHIDERRKMMQEWANFLDGLRGGAKVLQLRNRVNDK